MALIDRIQQGIECYRLNRPEHYPAPTIYVGREQFAELQMLDQIDFNARPDGLPPRDQVLGCTLIQVRADDYLRVA